MVVTSGETPGNGTVLKELGRIFQGSRFSSAWGRGAGQSWELGRLGSRGTETLLLYFFPDFQIWAWHKSIAQLICPGNLDFISLGGGEVWASSNYEVMAPLPRGT